MKRLITPCIVLVLFIQAAFCIPPEITFSYKNSDQQTTTKSAAPALPTSVSIKSIYGDCEISDPAFIAILQSSAMERIKKVTQGGITDIIFPEIAFSRFDHSVGLAVLLHKFGASLEEQYAGLTHDLSHTAFSHVGCLLNYQGIQRNAYQDNIFEWYMHEQGMDTLLAPYGITIASLNPTDEKFTMFDRDIPELDLHRLEYLLHTGIVWKQITLADVTNIVNHVRYENNEFFFTDEAVAKQWAQLGLYFSENLYGAPWNKLMYLWTVKALKRGFEIGLISPHEFHFSNDFDVWAKLEKSDDPAIAAEVTKIKNVHDYYEEGDAENHDFVAKTKLRCSDPYVQTANGLKRLTEVNEAFRNEFARVKAAVGKGRYYKLTHKNAISPDDIHLTQAIF